MVRGNFIGAAVVAVIYTVYLLKNPHAVGSKPTLAVLLVILNALTIVLMAFAFK